MIYYLVFKKYKLIKINLNIEKYIILHVKKYLLLILKNMNDLNEIIIYINLKEKNIQNRFMKNLFSFILK